MSNITVINGIKWDIEELVNRRYLSKTCTLDKIKKVNKLPLVDGHIFFTDDYWDFGSLDSVVRSRSTMEYDFSNINYYYKDIIKGIILNYIIIDNKAFSTIKERFRILANITDYLAFRHIVRYELITLKVVRDYCENISKDFREETRKYYRNAFKALLKFINLNEPEIDYTSVFQYLNKQAPMHILKAEREDGKTPDIPVDFLNQMISCAIKDLNDDYLSGKEKRDACIVLLLSQTGMRIGELRLLEANKMSTLKIFEDEQEVYYLTFKTFKTIKGNRFKWTKTFMTDKAAMAYKYMELITGEERKKYNTDYLFCNFKDDDLNPLTTNTLRNRLLPFVVRHMDIINCINRKPEEVEGFHIAKVGSTQKTGRNYIPVEYIKDLRTEDKVCCPNPHQFRVAVCTRLYEQGIDVDWIREHMNHLSEEMTIHYIRKKEQSEKEKEYARSIIKGIVTEDFRLIGKDRDILMNKIEEFIKINKYNVKDNLDQIIDELANKIPIREKEYGFCIKSAFGRKCAQDGVGEEVFCALGLCPNHFTNYKVVDITYERCLNIIKVIEYNFKNGFVSEAQIESNKLNRIINESLIPELEELILEKNKKGIQVLVEKNSHLENIIKNAESILIEVKKWKTA